MLIRAHNALLLNLPGRNVQRQLLNSAPVAPLHETGYHERMDGGTEHGPHRPVINISHTHNEHFTHSCCRPSGRQQLPTQRAGGQQSGGRAPVARGGQDGERVVEHGPVGVVGRGHAELVVLHYDIFLGVLRHLHQIALPAHSHTESRPCFRAHSRCRLATLLSYLRRVARGQHRPQDGSPGTPHSHAAAATGWCKEACTCLL